MSRVRSGSHPMRPLMLSVAYGAVAALVLATAGEELPRLLHPRVLPWTVVGGGALAMLAVAELMRMLPGGNQARPVRQSNLARPSSLAWWPLALLLAFAPAAGEFNSAQFAAARLSGTGFLPPAGSSSGGSSSAGFGATPLAPEFRGVPGLDPAATVGPDGAPLYRTEELPAWAQGATEPPPLPAWGEGLQELTMESHADIVEAMYREPQWFEDRQIAITGFVFREPQWTAEIYAIARMAIWCCAADSILIGLLAQQPPPQMPPVDSWVRVTATIRVLEQFESANGTLYNVPVLTEVQWQAVARPAFEYIMPAGW